MRDLSGVHPPVATPFGEDGELALDAFDNNLREWLSHPVAGIVVAGSTGEAPLLDRRELCALVETTAARIGDRTLTVGTGAESTREVTSVTREVAGLGANAVLVRSGSYYLKAMKPDVVRDHFLAVADTSPVPVVLYHIPQFVPVHLTPDLVGRLVEHPNIIGIKDSSGDLRNLGQLIEACGRNAQVLVGSGALLYAALEAGAVGGILGVAVVATRSCCQIYDAWREGDHRRAGAMQERVAPLHKRLVAEGGIVSVKVALDRLGLYGGPPRSPLQPADDARLAAVDAALEAAALGVSARPRPEAGPGSPY